VRPVLLELDEALERQPGLRAAAAARGGAELAARDLGPALRLWSRPGVLRALARRLEAALPPGREPEIVFAGSGDFHHVTPLLLERAIARAGEPVTVLHFDNHPDWARLAVGPHCGAWVRRAARMAGVAQVITVGLTSEDVGAKAEEGDLALVAQGRLQLFAWRAPGGAAELRIGDHAWPTVAHLGESAFLDHLDAAVRTRSVYVTIDKDVLRPEDAVTNWDQGEASLDFVEAAVRRIAWRRRLVGADVVGDWSPPAYGHGPMAWAKRAEAFLDQPRRAPDAGLACAVNEAANLRLLNLFAGAAA